MELKLSILNGILLHLEAEKAKAKVCLDNYLYNSAGIGEHPDIMDEAIKMANRLDAAESTLKTVRDAYADELEA
tara:strand:+ start:5202 stop:5423 length:222 start_codon:yes stop_codon:yes gene_type:complete